MFKEHLKSYEQCGKCTYLSSTDSIQSFHMLCVMTLFINLFSFQFKSDLNPRFWTPLNVPIQKNRQKKEYAYVSREM